MVNSSTNSQTGTKRSEQKATIEVITNSSTFIEATVHYQCTLHEKVSMTNSSTRLGPHTPFQPKFKDSLSLNSVRNVSSLSLLATPSKSTWPIKISYTNQIKSTHLFEFPSMLTQTLVTLVTLVRLVMVIRFRCLHGCQAHSSSSNADWALLEIIKVLCREMDGTYH